MADKILNLLTNCKNVNDFPKLDSAQYFPRQLDIYFSWRHLMITQGYIDKQRVFMSCTKLTDKNTNMRLFNMMAFGNFFKSISSVDEALASAGFNSSDLHGMCKLTIPDVNAEDGIIDGCVLLHFSDANTKLTGNVFANIIPVLYDRLCGLADQTEKERNVLYELEDDIRKLNELNNLAESSDLEVFSDVYSSAKNVVEKWQPYSYLLLSKHATIREAYEKIMYDYFSFDSSAMSSVSDS